jgi:uncharacterized protein
MNDFTGAGWAFPLGADAAGGIALAGGHQKIEQAMRLILATYPGERPMRPLWGSTLRDYVFAEVNTDTMAAIGRVVRTSLDLWEPRAEVVEVDVYPDEGTDGLLYIDISYREVDVNSPRNLVFPFYTIPARDEDEEED